MNIGHGLKGLFLAMAGVLLFGCAAQQMQPAGPLFETSQITASKYEPGVDDFVVILDASSSMNEKCKGTEKLKIAKDFLWAMSQTLPELKYNGTLRTFGKYHDVSKDLTEIVYGPAKFSKAGFKDGLMAVRQGEGTSHLEFAVSAAGNDLMSAKGKVAVVVVSDGKDMNNEPVVAARELKNRFGDRLCIYTVLIGEDRGGKKLLESIATAGSCGFLTGPEEFKTGQDIAEFVKMVFLTERTQLDSDGDGVTDDRDDCPNTPKGASVNKRGCWAYSPEALFDFDSYNIKSNAYAMLSNAVSILEENPELKVDIQGHTDNTGVASYNMELSEKRAESVKAYFVSKGIDPARITTKGYGPSQPTASNETKEGRTQNRRIQLVPVR